MRFLLARIAAALLLSSSAFAQTNQTPPPHAHGAQSAAWPHDGTKKNVAIVVHEGVELLDFAGPFEVFRSAGSAGAFNVYTVAPTSSPINSMGLSITPNYSVSACPAPDIIVVPGGATGLLIQSSETMEWLRASSKNAQIVMSVCTGAFALQNVGLLDGMKEVTTHWGSVTRLAGQLPAAKVRTDVRFVDGGKIITTAGISAGIDGALHVVERLLGSEDAWRTARYMQYEWEPAKGNLPPRKHEALRHLIMNEYDQAQTLLGAMLTEDPRDPWARIKLAEAQLDGGHPELTIKTIREGDSLGHTTAETLRVLARAQLSTKDNAGAAASFTRAIELGATDTTTLYNLACALSLAGDKSKALGALDRAVTAGFTARWYLENDEDLASIRTEPRFAEIVKRVK